MVVKNKELPFYSEGCNTDVTDRTIKVLQEKVTVCNKEGYTYFGWKGVGSSVGCALTAYQNLIVFCISFYDHGATRKKEAITAASTIVRRNSTAHEEEPTRVA